MGPTLLGLIKLQSVENRLRAVKAKLARCRRNVIIQENQIRSLQNALEAKQEEIQLTRLQADRLELELKSRDESIAKLRTALNTAKTNKEYAAILTELNTNKADNSKIENQILELMKAIEADQTDCLQIKQQIEEQKAKLEQVRKDSETMAVKVRGRDGHAFKPNGNRRHTTYPASSLGRSNESPKRMTARRWPRSNSRMPVQRHIPAADVLWG